VFEDGATEVLVLADRFMSPKRARTPRAVARKGLEKTRAGILVQDEAHGLDDGTEALQRALSVLRNSATGQSMIPFDRR